MTLYWGTLPRAVRVVFYSRPGQSASWMCWSSVDTNYVPDARPQSYTIIADSLIRSVIAQQLQPHATVTLCPLTTQLAAAATAASSVSGLVHFFIITTSSLYLQSVYAATRLLQLVNTLRWHKSKKDEVVYNVYMLLLAVLLGVIPMT